MSVRRLTLGLLLIGSASLAAAVAWFDWNSEPDLPGPLVAGKVVDKEAFMLARAEHLALLRGIDVQANRAYSPEWREAAIADMEAAQARAPETSTTQWTPLGPAPIPNGQTVGPVTPVSGRVISIAVHPTNADIVYVGTAAGGLYRSTNGGTTWTAMMDNALSLAIGSLALAPSSPDTLYVGTGEPNFSADSFFGVGLYRIDGASGASPTLVGPLNKDAGNNDLFTGRSISEIVVHPTLPGTIFVSTASGIAGIGATANPTLPARGVFRSSNATSASPVFERLTGLAGNGNFSVRDIVLDPLNPNFLVASVVVTNNALAGIYVSTDALGVAPTFTQRVSYTNASTSEVNAELAIQRTVGAPNPTVYVATGNLGGRVLVNTDGGGASWPQQIDNNFCTPQCFYDIAIAVAPNDATRVYLAGAPAVPFAFSTTSGTAFTVSSSGLHVDSHAITVAPGTPTTLYLGTDGGIYRSTDSGANWTPLNNATFSATQFQSIATHPRNPELMIGGTQDNGTQLRNPDASWFRTDGGDGGHALIDQGATDTVSVRMFHTYFNNTAQMAYARVTTLASAQAGNWAAFGCGFGGVTANGMTCAASAILFYAPMALGPGTPNTVYFGSDVLYRSSDGGTSMTKVSQEPLTSGQAISAIGIAPGDDGVRVVGLRNGALFRALAGATTLTSIDPVGVGSVIPDLFVSRIEIERGNANIAYIVLSGYAGAGQSVFKTSNLLSATPTFSAAANGVPNIPANAFVIDPASATTLYLGTDIGVYRSTDAGVNWAPYGSGLPRVPVFDMAFQAATSPAGRGNLRIATHGRGIWEIAFDGVHRDGFE